jgi:Tfp pilus assembly protein PilZ
MLVLASNCLLQFFCSFTAQKWLYVCRFAAVMSLGHIYVATEREYEIGIYIRSYLGICSMQSVGKKVFLVPAKRQSKRHTGCEGFVAGEDGVK